jgi:hypothetical protein
VEGEAKKRAKAAAQMEEQIHQTEKMLAKLAVDLQSASAAGAFDKIQRLSAEYTSRQGHLETLLAEWERVAGG